MNTGGGFESGDAGAKTRAEKLCAAAFASPWPEERLALAEEALALNPGCADARTLLAREASRTGRREEALAHADAAVVAAEDALDEGAKGLLAGPSRKLWRRKILRPYLRALGELARALRDAGDLEAALEGLIRSRAESLGLLAEFLRADAPAGYPGAPQMLVVAGDAEDLYELCEELAGAEATSGYVVIADLEEDADGLAELGINAHTPECLEGAWAEILSRIDGAEE